MLARSGFLELRRGCAGVRLRSSFFSACRRGFRLRLPIARLRASARRTPRPRLGACRSARPARSSRREPSNSADPEFAPGNRPSFPAAPMQRTCRRLGGCPGSREWPLIPACATGSPTTSDVFGRGMAQVRRLDIGSVGAMPGTMPATVQGRCLRAATPKPFSPAGRPCREPPNTGRDARPGRGWPALRNPRRQRAIEGAGASGLPGMTGLACRRALRSAVVSVGESARPARGATRGRVARTLPQPGRCGMPLGGPRDWAERRRRAGCGRNPGVSPGAPALGALALSHSRCIDTEIRCAICADRRCT